MSRPTDEDRLMNLEMAHANLSRDYEQLNDVVIRHDRSIDQLVATFRRLEEKMDAILDALEGDDGSVTSPPPRA